MYLASYFYFMPYLLSMINIHENIRALRKSKGWTQTELAEILGTSQKVITSYETGIKKPPIQRLPDIAAVFDISIEELLGKKELQIKQQIPHVHKNSRIVRMQGLFKKLQKDEQRVILKQVQALVTR